MAGAQPGLSRRSAADQNRPGRKSPGGRAFGDRTRSVWARRHALRGRGSHRSPHPLRAGRPGAPTGRCGVGGGARGARPCAFRRGVCSGSAVVAGGGVGRDFSTAFRCGWAFLIAPTIGLTVRAQLRSRKDLLFSPGWRPQSIQMLGTPGMRRLTRLLRSRFSLDGLAVTTPGFPSPASWRSLTALPSGRIVSWSSIFSRMA